MNSHDCYGGMIPERRLIRDHIIVVRLMTRGSVEKLAVNGSFIACESILWSCHSFSPSMITHFSSLSAPLGHSQGPCHQNNRRGCVMKTMGTCRHKEPLQHPVQSRSSWMSRTREAKPFPLMMTKQSAFMKRVALWYYQHISRTVFVSRGIDIKSKVYNITVYLMFDILMTLKLCSLKWLAECQTRSTGVSLIYIFENSTLSSSSWYQSSVPQSQKKEKKKDDFF